MKKITLVVFFINVAVNAQTVFINEIHYDNTGGDVNEAVEIAGPSGTDLSMYSLELYNNVGSLYDTENLTGIIPNQQDGMGTLTFPITGIQNGPADGLALVNGAAVIQLLSYEGTLTPTGGTASGMTSVDIGVSELGTTATTESLQLAGTGAVYSDFTWQSPAAATQGSVNNGQTFNTTVLNNTEHLALKNKTVLHPNPSLTGMVSLQTSLKEGVEVTIYTSLGAQLSAQLVKNRESITTDKLAAGIYFVQLTHAGNTTTKRIVVQ